MIILLRACLLFEISSSFFLKLKIMSSSVVKGRVLELEVLKILQDKNIPCTYTGNLFIVKVLHYSS
jgi:hypothetical protein